MPPALKKVYPTFTATVLRTFSVGTSVLFPDGTDSVPAASCTETGTCAQVSAFHAGNYFGVGGDLCNEIGSAPRTETGACSKISALLAGDHSGAAGSDLFNTRSIFEDFWIAEYDDDNYRHN